MIELTSGLRKSKKSWCNTLRISRALKAYLNSLFSVSHSLLDNYIERQVSQDVKSNLSICYVLSEPEHRIVKGYDTLASNAISRDILPEDLSKRLPPGYRTFRRLYSEDLP